MELRDYTIRGPAKALLNVSDIASMLGVSEATVKRLVAEGRFPRGIKPGPQLGPIWEATDIAAWLHLASLRLALLCLTDAEHHHAELARLTGEAPCKS